MQRSRYHTIMKRIFMILSFLWGIVSVSCFVASFFWADTRYDGIMTSLGRELIRCTALLAASAAITSVLSMLFHRKSVQAAPVQKRTKKLKTATHSLLIVSSGLSYAFFVLYIVCRRWIAPIYVLIDLALWGAFTAATIWLLTAYQKALRREKEPTKEEKIITKEIVFKRIGIVILIFMLCALIFSLFLCSLEKSMIKSQYRLLNFSSYRSDFQTLAWSARELYQQAKEKYGDDLKLVIIHSAGDEWQVKHVLKADLKADASYYITPSENEKEAYQAVQAGIHTIHNDNDAGFTGIRVTDQHVIFLTTMPTSVCYGYRPPRAENDRKQYVDVLALHWYQIYII